MSDPRGEVLAKIDAAFKEIAALNHGKKWQMRVPVDATDSDEVISAGLLAAREFVRAVAPAGASPSEAALAAAREAGYDEAGIMSGMSVEVPNIEAAVRAAYFVDFGAAAPRDAPDA